MKQACLEFELNAKKTRKQVFLNQMEPVVPWGALVELIAPYYFEGKTGRPPFSLETMLRVHFMRQWFTLHHPDCVVEFRDGAQQTDGGTGMSAPEIRGEYRTRAENQLNGCKKRG